MLAVVVADGEPALDDALLARQADLLVAADGGARWLAAQGIVPQLVVGDLDSLDELELERLRASGTRIERHPQAKDASDAELALAAAIAAGAERVTLLGALGGIRLDHELANLMLLVDSTFARIDLRVVRGATLVRGITGAESLAIDAGLAGIVTLLPVGGDALGVSTDGLRYALEDETLLMGRSRGLSNEVVEVPASVSLRTGSLLVIEVGQGGGSSTKGET
jgi:thiamine pyrophosphokinase